MCHKCRLIAIGVSCVVFVDVLLYVGRLIARCTLCAMLCIVCEWLCVCRDLGVEDLYTCGLAVW